MSRAAQLDATPGPASPPDQAARDRIVTDLDTSFLVEAGAGSGKTTSLVGRVLALLESGRATVDQIAAVTFTKKAASELGERFQNALEARLAAAREGADPAVAERLDAALGEIERAFVGTIHAFCARLLRERPIAAGLDPDFRELTGPEADEHRQRFWRRWLEERQGDPGAARLGELGIRPDRLEDGFARIDANRDVTFDAGPEDRPDPAPVRAALEELLDRALEHIPRREPADGWGKLQKKVRRLAYVRRTPDWRDDAAFFDVLATVVGWKQGQETQKRWGAGPARAKAKELSLAFQEFGADGGAAERALSRWYAHRYPFALEFVQEAADAYVAYRRRNGRLTFQDLLLLAARLLRDDPSARRELGRRYRWLLVDEFQDTDPLQAEVVFLLAAREEDLEETDWRKVVPRPGALFVVGDPKQSIYRFTRADIAVYQMARRRFEAFAAAGTGGVLELVANFRSRPSIERFVNAEFDPDRGGRFESEATDEQAAFAPLAVQREASEAERVGCYTVEAARPWGRFHDVTRADADRVAGWIRHRIDAGERSPGDFLILPYHRKFLTHYAEALEARNVPVQVTGAEVVLETELAELRLLLETLVDPEDPTLVVAVLIGLFFGIDHEELAAHALAGGSFRFTAPPRGPDGPVVEALERLRGWWRLSRRLPADVTVATIVDELGLLPYAAASGLGAVRAGAVGYLLEVIREMGLEGETSLRAAMEAIDAALDLGEAEAPLEPGREDVVRVMNLHKAKGTEATVVVLAGPTGWREFEPRIRVERTADGEARGWLEIRDEALMGRPVLARPLAWTTVHAPVEQRFERAERERLLYVAATRARDELVVGRVVRPDGRTYDQPSFWRPFYACLDRDWPALDLVEAPVPERLSLERTAEQIAAEVAAVDRDREARGRPGYRAVAVSRLAKEEDGEAALRGSGGRGPTWGSAVHQALEAAVSGLEGDALEAACRIALVAHDRPIAPDGEPAELDDLVGLVEAIAASDLFERARASERLLVEVPFALRREASSEAGGEPGDPPVEVLEGVIDLAFREDRGWTIADYKTDVVDDEAALTERRRLYRAQVDLYAECWEALSGEPVVERTLFFTATGEIERW